MKRNTRAKIGVMVCCLTLICAAGAADLHAAGSDGLMGSWIVNIRPEGGGKVVNLAAINADGTVTNSDPDFATGVGSWEYAGGREYAVKFVHLVSSPERLPPGTRMLAVRAVVKLRGSGARATGPFVTSFLDAKGEELASFTGRARLKRIALD